MIGEERGRTRYPNALRSWKRRSDKQSSRRAILLYDGDCGVCTRLARFVARRLRPSASAGARAGGQAYGISAYQDADLPSLGLTAAQCDAALQWVDAYGRISSAQDAVARLLLASRPWARAIGAVLLAPGINALAGVVYRTVAANRSRLPGGTPACQLPRRAAPRRQMTTTAEDCIRPSRCNLPQ